MPPKRATNKTGKKLTKPEKKPRGRPSKFTPEVSDTILSGLANGTPLSVICSPDSMPDTSTVWDWAQKDEAFSQAIARAREAGFDVIAMDAIAIADSSEHDTIEFEKGGRMVQIPDKEWILRSKLRVDTRLKLLSKWDPKRYGDKVTQEITGKMETKTTMVIPDDLQDEIIAKTLEAAKIAALVQPPPSFRGMGGEE